MAQMKHRDPQAPLLFQHLRNAIDVLEQIVSYPYCPSPEPATERLASAPPPPSPPVVSSEKLTYSIREASAAFGISRSTLYDALAKGELQAIKLGTRTLISADGLRAWLASRPVKWG